MDPDSMAITWEDIGGLIDVIEQIKETVIFPFKRRELFLHSKLLQPPKGLVTVLVRKNYGFYLVNLKWN